MKVFIFWRHILSNILLLQSSLTAGQPNWQEAPMNTMQIQGKNVQLNCKLQNMGSVPPMWIRVNGNGSLKQIAIGETVYNDCCEVTGNHGQGEYNLLIKNLNVSKHEGIWQCTHIEANPQNIQANITVIVPVSSVKITKNADCNYTCEAMKGKPPAFFLWTIGDLIDQQEGRVAEKYKYGIADSISFYFVNCTAAINGSNLTCQSVQPLLEDMGRSDTITVYFNDTIPDSTLERGNRIKVKLLYIITPLMVIAVAAIVVWCIRKRTKRESATPGETGHCSQRGDAEEISTPEPSEKQSFMVSPDQQQGAKTSPGSQQCRERTKRESATPGESGHCSQRGDAEEISTLEPSEKQFLMVSSDKQDGAQTKKKSQQCRERKNRQGATPGKCEANPMSEIPTTPTENKSLKEDLIKKFDF